MFLSRLFKNARSKILLAFTALSMATGIITFSTLVGQSDVIQTNAAGDKRRIYMAMDTNFWDSSAKLFLDSKLTTGGTLANTTYNFEWERTYYGRDLFHVDVPNTWSTGYVIRTSSDNSVWNYTNAITLSNSSNYILLKAYSGSLMTTSCYNAYPRVDYNGTKYPMDWDSSTSKWVYDLKIAQSGGDGHMFVYQETYINDSSTQAKYLGWVSGDPATYLGSHGCSNGSTKIASQDGHDVNNIATNYGKYTITVDSVKIFTQVDPSWSWNSGSTISFTAAYKINYKGYFFKGTHSVATNVDLTAAVTTSFPTTVGTDVAFAGETYTADASEWTTYKYPESTGTDYTFIGWYSDSGLTTPFTSRASVSSGFNLYAKFSDSNKYTLTYQCVVDGALNTQQSGTISSIDSGTSYASLASPSLYGYSFDGWYSDSSCNTPLSGGYVGDDVDVFAKFTRLSTNRTYYIDVHTNTSAFNNYMYVYYWRGAIESIASPGLLLTGITDVSDIYSFSIPSDATGFRIGLNNNNNYQRTVDLTPNLDHNLYVITSTHTSGDTKQSGVWKDAVYYLEGDETFTGNASTAWKTSGAVIMHEPTNASGNAAEATGVVIKNSSKVKIVMLYGDASGNLRATWYGTLGSSYTFASNEAGTGNIVFGASAGGTYSFYLKNGQVFIENDANQENYGYIYFSSSAPASTITITAKNSHGDTVQNNTKLSYITFEKSTDTLTFNSVKGMHKVSLYNIRGNNTTYYVNKVTFNDGSTTTEVNFTDDATKPVYYVVSGNSSNNKNGDIAKEAKVAFDIDMAIKGASNSSICNVPQATATSLVTAYSNLASKTNINAATIETWDGSNTVTAGTPVYSGSETYTMVQIMARMALVAAGRTSAWIIPSSAKTESPLTMTLWIVLGSGLAGLAAIGTAYFVSKKKKRYSA